MSDLDPVIIGVGDVVNRSKEIKDAVEPLHLMLKAIEEAFADAAIPPALLRTFKKEVDSIAVVNTWTWPYSDLAKSICERLGIDPQRKENGPKPGGGNNPVKLMDEACQRIASGSTKYAIVTGGEALASLTAFAAAKKFPPKGWTQPEKDVKTIFTATNASAQEGIGGAHGIYAPIQIYPLYENALRAHKRQSIKENNIESARLYAEFAQVASENPNAWTYGQKPKTSKAIGTVSQKNRMICFPYPLLMNAFNTVNVAGAVLITSKKRAKNLGIPEDKWIYVLGAAGTQDSTNFWERPNFHTSPAISRSIDTALINAGCPAGQVDLFDIYSCFPIVPKLACDHLGLAINDREKPVTLLGGLTSFGGAGNNYSMHSATQMVRALRNGEGSCGLVLANGGVVTYEHAMVFSKNQRQDGKSFATQPSLPEVLTDIPCPEVEAEANGEATIETYTVEYKRDGSPQTGFIIGRLHKNGRRFVSIHADGRTLRQLISFNKEPIGRKGVVKYDAKKKKNLFSIGNESRL